MRYPNNPLSPCIARTISITAPFLFIVDLVSFRFVSFRFLGHLTSPFLCDRSSLSFFPWPSINAPHTSPWVSLSPTAGAAPRNGSRPPPRFLRPRGTFPSPLCSPYLALMQPPILSLPNPICMQVSAEGLSLFKSLFPIQPLSNPYLTPYAGERGGSVPAAGGTHE